MVRSPFTNPHPIDGIIGRRARVLTDNVTSPDPFRSRADLVYNNAYLQSLGEQLHRARQLPGVHLIAILPDPRMRLRLLPPRAHLRRDDVETRRGARVQNDGHSPRYRTSGPSTPLVAVGGVSIDG